MIPKNDTFERSWFIIWRMESFDFCSKMCIRSRSKIIWLYLCLISSSSVWIISSSLVFFIFLEPKGSTPWFIFWKSIYPVWSNVSPSLVLNKFGCGGSWLSGIDNWRSSCELSRSKCIITSYSLYGFSFSLSNSSRVKALFKSKYCDSFLLVFSFFCRSGSNFTRW